MSEKPEKEERTWTEEIEVAGRELVDRVKELVEQGNVRRLIIRRSTGEVLLELPLTTSVVVGGVLTIFTPVLAALGAMAALLAKVKIEVVRVKDEGEDEE
jgi:hypothetical protein